MAVKADTVLPLAGSYRYPPLRTREEGVHEADAEGAAAVAASRSLYFQACPGGAAACIGVDPGDEAKLLVAATNDRSAGGREDERRLAASGNTSTTLVFAEGCAAGYSGALCLTCTTGWACRKPSTS